MIVICNGSSGVLLMLNALVTGLLSIVVVTMMNCPGWNGSVSCGWRMNVFVVGVSWTIWAIIAVVCMG